MCCEVQSWQYFAKFRSTFVQLSMLPNFHNFVHKQNSRNFHAKLFSSHFSFFHIRTTFFPPLLKSFDKVLDLYYPAHLTLKLFSKRNFSPPTSLKVEINYFLEVYIWWRLSQKSSTAKKLSYTFVKKFYLVLTNIYLSLWGNLIFHFWFHTVGDSSGWFCRRSTKSPPQSFFIRDHNRMKT